MKTLLLTFVLLRLVATLQAQGPRTWYMKATVSNKNLTKGKRLREAFPVAMIALEGGNETSPRQYPKAQAGVAFKGHCHEKKILMQKTEETGEYRDLKGKKRLYIEELPVMDHAIFYCEGQHHGKTFCVAKLMGRTSEENLEALEEFKEFAQCKGLLQEDIFMLEQRECPTHSGGLLTPAKAMTLLPPPNEDPVAPTERVSSLDTG
ncbi:odorant-binding protein 2b-like [Castor canadensis]|uniref:Odorant-binding protein 2b-like n=1 Tax=Castor canadensis TaxID=51338 RepID=A0A8B7UA88_CASCN|nr:odorant-binding protein 2b-like [Castor canadensis]